MVKCSVLFEVRTEFLNIIYTSFDFKGLRNLKPLSQSDIYAFVSREGLIPYEINFARQLVM
jgi:hypothetical protein